MIRLTRNRSTTKSSRRAGAVLIVAIVSLIVTSLILASLVQLAAICHQQERAEQIRLQAQWLAESGIERAADRLAADPKYAGESWQIAATDFDSGAEGKVEISIAAETNGNQKITAIAIYPSNASNFAKITKQVTFRARSKP